jgi:hypothetical protein
MTKPKYASPEERRAAMSENARKQMLAQWERQRQESGQDGPGYYGCHRRVRTERGRAADQMCACGSRARHWAHIHGTDPSDPQNYQAMCQKCHWAYDQVGPRGMDTKGPAGRSQTAVLAWSRRSPEQRRDILRKAWETRRATQG